MSVRTLSFCQDSQVSVRTLKFACQDSQVYVRTAPSGRFRRGRARSKGGLGVYHSLLGGRGRRVAVKEGGGLVGGTCEHCEDRAPSGPRQDSVRTLSGLSGQVREVHKPGCLAAAYRPSCNRAARLLQQNTTIPSTTAASSSGASTAPGPSTSTLGWSTTTTLGTTSVRPPAR